MVAGAFPLAKLGFLAIKQISKPIANSIARRAKSSRLFREYVCIPIAQLFHWYDVRVRMRIMNLGKVTSVPKLNEEKAIEQGSQLLSEFIILSVASGVILYEYNRQSEKEEVKQEQLEREKALINDKIINLEVTVEEQRAQIKELTRLTYALHDKKTFSIFKSKENTEEVKKVSNIETEENNNNESYVISDNSESSIGPEYSYQKGPILAAVESLFDKGQLR